MDNLCDLTAVAVTWRIGGREYRLSPLRLVDLGEIERAFIEAATDRVSQPGLALEQLGQWLETSAVRELAFWLCLRRNHPNVPHEAAKDLLRQARDTTDDFDRLWPSLIGIPPNHSALDTPHSTFSAIFVRLSQAYSWIPQQIGELTLPQLLAYMRDEPDERRTMWMTPAEARARRAAHSAPSTKPQGDGTPRSDDVENADDGDGLGTFDVQNVTDADESGGMPRQAGEELDQIVQCMAEVRLSLRRLERRDDVARYATPGESG